MRESTAIQRKSGTGGTEPTLNNFWLLSNLILLGAQSPFRGSV